MKLDASYQCCSCPNHTTNADEDALPPRLSRTGSSSAAKRRLFNRLGPLARLSHSQRVGAATAAGAATLLVLLALSAGVSRLDASGGTARPPRETPSSRLLLAGGPGRRSSRLARAAAAGQLPWQGPLQLFNVSMALAVGGGAEAAALAGPLREPFLHALMSASAAAAGAARLHTGFSVWLWLFMAAACNNQPELARPWCCRLPTNPPAPLAPQAAWR